ncbi:hypothetical protein Q3G72_014028 [Acer saccharum]|nr:hypothetical protein Q3G72_014028 [Acer saccharum]
MSSTSRAWMVATSIAAVEALKDQGFCRWNYPIRALHQQAKNNLRSASQAKKLSSSSSAALVSTMVMRSENKAKQSEESLRKVITPKMSSTSGSWMAAADSIAAVEALKDQELCRWNHTIDSIQLRVKNNLSSISQAKKKLSSDKKAREAEALRKVMYLSCWGPY